MLEKRGDVVSQSERRGQLPRMSCEDAIASNERLVKSGELQPRLATVSN
jgi:hypothetical protein